MMEQYLKIKEEYKDEILFFRLGDFYEMFFEDAIVASKELDIALTKRAGGNSGDYPMCGVPYHVADNYISKLINKGYKVAICDQMEDPATAKGLVKREVTKIFTPGTFTDYNYLKRDENNYLLSIVLSNKSLYMSYADYSTGELYTTFKSFFNIDDLVNFLIDECYRINPSEILINKFENKYIKEFLNASKFYINYIDENLEDISLTDEDETYINSNIFKDLNVLKAENKVDNFASIYNLLKYLIRTQKNDLNHLNNIIFYEDKNFLILDEHSKRNLELIKGINTNSKSESLLEILDRTKTSMGSRELKKWIEEPLIDKVKIEKRLDIIESLNEDLILLNDISTMLKEIYDIERLSVKISNKTISPKEMISLLNSLKAIKEIKNLLQNSQIDTIVNLSLSLDPLEYIVKEIESIIVDDPPAVIDDNRFIKKGYSEDLDILFEASDEGKSWILNLEEKEKNRTGIKNLRVKYNKILGYFIEVTKSNISQVPDEYIRKQTLVGSERYFSIELKEMESKILGSKDEALKLQMQIFNNLKSFLLENLYFIQKTAKEISKVDVFVSLSTVARENQYIRPTLNDSGIISIKNGRHPIVESKFMEELFVPNDTYMDMDKNLIHVITGPNMAGKSTYMRQVALIIIMAHMGSFVPCESANISIVDRIFTRIGASDNLARGESTFMVEMKEVSNIIKNATKNSFLILDEVGRGTSTYDGLAIAWAIIEYIATDVKAKTLFATHYHELVNLKNKYNCISNLTIAVEKKEDTIIFLRKIIEGFSNNSYGIEVAKLAGVNDYIVSRANELLQYIQNNEDMNINKNILKKDSVKIEQKSIFDVKKDNFINEISSININEISPIEAMNLLNQLIINSKDLK
ncbi:DNA mismatch repair protein MutS [Anaerosphaera multitolerans]|uniref:DNA mismatch repair protein MutS n=2 Tax=Anaerosphaera multitolerans TaxID=2487351 RepID=A0A437S5A4_9FIRM|nr:DNA mismatch repair protein MutS [Anaerosphaera multitolerans]RVU54190.1 DNA mismatch repair protein MutS [Anaerosphaera multitolerans]